VGTKERAGATTHKTSELEAVVSEARTPEEETIEEKTIESELTRIPDEDVPVEDEYEGPDPEDDPKGDGADEDQGT
jgi:hypothetical protein